MPGSARLRRNRGVIEFWPGFVDALSTLLIVIIFLILVFVLAQFFLNQAIETIRTTFFRQTMFAEFEMKAHEAGERNEALTGDAVRVPVHDQRPVLEVADDARRHRLVVGDEVALGDPVVREENLVQVRQLDWDAPHASAGLLRHAGVVTRPAAVQPR